MSDITYYIQKRIRSCYVALMLIVNVRIVVVGTHHIIINIEQVYFNNKINNLK